MVRSCILTHFRGRRGVKSANSSRSTLIQQQQRNSRRPLSSLSREELLEIRESLRQYGSTDDTVSCELASEMSKKKYSAWSKLGDSTAVITVSNPSSRNAFTGKMMAELADIVDELESNHGSLRSIVVRGQNKFFCAGADLGVAKEHLITKDGGFKMSSTMMDSLSRFQKLPLVSVALIEGMAVGGGAELCTAMDYRIMHDRSTIQFVHAKMGLSPGWGGGTRLARDVVGRARALELLGASKACNAQECLEMKLVDKVTPTPETTTIEFLERFTHADPHVLQGIKRVVAHAENDDCRRTEQDVFLSLWGGESNRKALKTALKKSK